MGFDTAFFVQYGVFLFVRPNILRSCTCFLEQSPYRKFSPNTAFVQKHVHTRFQEFHGKREYNASSTIERVAVQIDADLKISWKTLLPTLFSRPLNHQSLRRSQTASSQSQVKLDETPR